MQESPYINLYELEVYKMSRELSKLAWEMYEPLDWRLKKINGDQFIESTDSTGANIAEGYGRFHYLDRIKFYYNSRASLFECWLHWLDLMEERSMVDKDKAAKFREIAKQFSIKLNNFITVTYKNRDK